MIVDLHTHTFFSDGLLCPAESVRRAKVAGYRGIAITDHADHSNYKYIIESITEFKNIYNSQDENFCVLSGAEITHVRPKLIGNLVNKIRDLGADIVTVHGETITEPVEEGTNMAAILAGVDILAHPGLIDESTALLAAQRGVYLEITTRRGHSAANGNVALMAKKTGARLIINNDAHEPGDYVGKDRALSTLLGAGLTKEEAFDVFKNTVELFEKKAGIKF